MHLTLALFRVSDRLDYVIQNSYHWDAIFFMVVSTESPSKQGYYFYA
jgi:hypothetical protein